MTVIIRAKSHVRFYERQTGLTADVGVWKPRTLRE